MFTLPYLLLKIDSGADDHCTCVLTLERNILSFLPYFMVVIQQKTEVAMKTDWIHCPLKLKLL